MALNNYKISEILNLDELAKLFKHFSITTGLDVALYDSNGRIILSCQNDNCICTLSGDNTKCNENIKYGGEKAKELGEPYIFSCGCGLIKCSSPIVFNDELIGSIACGPVMLWEEDEYAICELNKNLANIGADINPDSLKNIKQLSCVNLTSSSALLYVLVNYMCSEQMKNLEQKLEIARQKENISSLIKDKKRISKTDITLNKYPADLEKKLIAYVQLGEKNKAKEVINNYLGQMLFYANGDIDIIKAKIYEFTAFLSRAAVEAGAPLGSMLNSIKNSSKFFNENTDFNDLCALTIEILYNFIDTVYENRTKKHKSQHLTNAVIYIKGHFAEEITLDSLSKAVFVSTYYLSHLFRDEMNTTFSDYLNKIRIEEAKDLIKNKDYNTDILCEKTGFKNTGYFLKTFKKITGVSLKEFKNIVKL